MINKNIMDELNRLGFGADVDALETYVLNLQDAAAAGTPEVTDAVYDMHFKLLKQLKPSSVAFMRNWESDDYELEPIDRILERYGMKSIATVTTMEDLAKFKSKLTEEPIDFCASIKLNGHAVRAVYRYGKLVGGSTRGRYKKGRNIIRHLRATLPNYVEKWKDYELVEVRGEMVVSHNNFEILSAFLKTHLNCVTSLMRESTTDNEIKLLDCVCYKCIISDENVDNNQVLPNLSEEMEHLQGCGFKVPKFIKVEGIDCYNFDEKVEDILYYFEELYDSNELEYDCDGVVVAINDNETFYSFGVDGNTWLGNFALKMGRVWESNKYKGIIESIEWEYGKTYITPKAIIQPVITVTGAEVATVPLYNVGIVERLKLYPGSEIYFRFGGESGVNLCDANGDSVSGLV